MSFWSNIGNFYKNALTAPWKNFTKLLNSLGTDSKSLGGFFNDVSGKSSDREANDAIADENASVAHERQKELMALEAQYNSVGYKAEQLGKAGLNPVLASGVSNAVGGASASMSAPSSGTSSVNPLELFKLFGEIDAQNLANDLAREDLAIKRATGPDIIATAKSEAKEKAATAGVAQKELDNFDTRFNADMAEQKARTDLYGKKQAEAEQSIKFMKNGIAQGYISSIAQLVTSIGITLGAIKGFLPKATEVLTAEVLDAPNGPVKTPDFDKAQKHLGRGFVEGVDDFTNLGDKGKFTMSDGSIFEFGLDDNGLPWAKSTSNGTEGGLADKMHEIFTDYIKDFVK